MAAEPSAAGLGAVLDALLRHDPRGDGTIGVEELGRLLNRLQGAGSWTEAAVRALMQTCGQVNAEGRMPIPSFVAGLAASASEAVPTPEQEEQEPNPYTSKEDLCRALNEGHTVLVSAEWFVEQRKRRGRLLRRQEMEREHPGSLIPAPGSGVGGLQPADIWEMRFTHNLTVNLLAPGKWLLVAVSYPWLAQDHPDPDGEQLKELAHYLGKMIDELRPYNKKVAVFLDYASLYQEPRSDDQRELFKRGLRSVNIWYGHQAVQVWALTHTAKDRPYHIRGWTTFEWRISLLTSFFVFDLGQISDPSKTLLKRWNLNALASARVQAEPPTPPERFDAEIEGKSFTNGKDDKPFVQRKYRETAEAILRCTRRLDFSGMRWSQQDLDGFLTGILPMCPSLFELSLNRCDGPTTFHIAGCPALGRLSLDDCKGLTSLAVDGSPRLQALALNRCRGLTDASLQGVVARCPRLQWIRLSACTGLTDDAVQSIAECCPDVLGVWLNSCSRLTDRAVQRLAERCAKLQTLSLNGCAAVTDAAVQLLARGCPDLRQLWLEGCVGLTDISAQSIAECCRSLQKLSAGGWKALTDDACRLIAGGCPGLQELWLDKCSGLKDVCVSGCRELRELSLTKCFRLTNVSVEGCADMQKLFLDGSPGITDDVVEGVVRSCPKLSELHLKNCVGVGNLSVRRILEGCPVLQDLRLSGCTALTDISPYLTGHEALSFLSLNRCTGLVDVSVRGCPSLQRLFVQSCLHLVSLSVQHCPALQLLSLKKCVALSDAAVQGILEACPGLQTLIVQGCRTLSADLVRRVTETLGHPPENTGEVD